MVDRDRDRVDRWGLRRRREGLEEEEWGRMRGGRGGDGDGKNLNCTIGGEKDGRRERMEGGMGWVRGVE